MERGRLLYSGILIFEMLWVVCMAQAAYILLLNNISEKWEIELEFSWIKTRQI